MTISVPKELHRDESLVAMAPQSAKARRIEETLRCADDEQFFQSSRFYRLIWTLKNVLPKSKDRHMMWRRCWAWAAYAHLAINHHSCNSRNVPNCHAVQNIITNRSAWAIHKDKIRRAAFLNNPLLQVPSLGYVSAPAAPSLLSGQSSKSCEKRHHTQHTIGLNTGTSRCIRPH